MKRTVFVFMVILMMAGVCGCVGRDDNKREMAAAHLKEKYNESFEVISFQPRNADSPYDEVVCVNGSGEKTKVYIDKSGEIVDDYYGIISKNKYKEILTEVVNEYLPEYKLFSDFTASYFDNDFTKDTDLESILPSNREQFFSRSYIFVSEKTAACISESDFNDMCEAFEKRGLSLLINVHSVSDSEYLEIDENGDVNQYIPQGYAEEPLYKKMIKTV